jgi:hypothetical protein
MKMDWSVFESVDHNAKVYGLHYTPPAADESFAIRLIMTECTQAISQYGMYLYSTLALSATATYRPIHIQLAAVTRNAGAPIIEGMNIILPDDYTDFGTSYAARFQGDGRSAKLCDTTYAIDLVGNCRFGAGIVTYIDTTEATDKDTASVVLQGGLGVEKKVFVGTDMNVGAMTKTGSLVGTRVTAGAGGTSGSPTVVSVTGKTIIELTPTGGSQYYELANGVDCQIVFMRVLNDNDPIYFTNVYGVFATGTGIRFTLVYNSGDGYWYCHGNYYL